MRPKHYLKNVLVLVPFIFSAQILNPDMILRALIGVAAFSLMASSIYIINDICDRNFDRKHARKKNRPIATGEVSVGAGIALCAALVITSLVISYMYAGGMVSVIVLVVYFLINAGYSAGLKNKPVLDITILSLGFILRVVYGGFVADVALSQWLLLTVFAFSFYMGLGKRRNEIISNGSNTRKVNAQYSVLFLDKNIYVCSALTIVFYALWTIDPIVGNKYLIYTVPLVLIILMVYSFEIEKKDSEGDPVGVITGSKILAALSALLAIILGILVYGGTA